MIENLTTNTVFQIIYLAIPKPLLVLEVCLIGEVRDLKNSFVGYRALFNPELEKLIVAIIVPTILHKFILCLLYYICSVYRTIPTKIKRMIALIDLIRKPFLQTHWCGQKLV